MNEFIKTINIYDYEHFRDRVVAECNISRMAWSRWRNGAAISEKYKPIIDQIAMEMFGRLVFQKGGGK